MKMLSVAAICLLLAMTGAPAEAKVDVEFANPEKYSDIANRWKGPREFEDGINGLRAALIQRGEAVLAPGQDLLIVVTNVDLAGRIYPNAFGGERIRMIKARFYPSIEFRYAVVENGGKIVREGFVNLSDPGFLDRYNRYFRDDILHFEKPMLDEWFAMEFGKPIQVARR